MAPGWGWGSRTDWAGSWVLGFIIPLQLGRAPKPCGLGWRGGGLASPFCCGGVQHALRWRQLSCGRMAALQPPLEGLAGKGTFGKRAVGGGGTERGVRGGGVGGGLCRAAAGRGQVGTREGRGQRGWRSAPRPASWAPLWLPPRWRVRDCPHRPAVKSANEGAHRREQVPLVLTRRGGGGRGGGEGSPAQRRDRDPGPAHLRSHSRSADRAGSSCL